MRHNSRSSWPRVHLKGLWAPDEVQSSSLLIVEIAAESYFRIYSVAVLELLVTEQIV